MEKVFCSAIGQGQPLVLIHGFCEDSRIWQTIAPALAQQHKLFLVDLPGFGQTALANAAETETVENMADRIAFTLQNLGVEKCTVIGHSLGGYVTLAMAERHPQMLSGLGLFHSTAYNDTEERKAIRQKQAEFVNNNGAIPYVKTLIPTLFAQKFEHDRLLEEALAIGKECSAQGIVNALQAMRQRPERLDVLKNAQVPVLIIAGAEDDIIPVEKLSYQASLPARCQFELFEKSGHMGQLEEPEISFEVINDFMGFVKHN
jgi:pimeloyl-ACP methyl ester carboxylesterase